MSSGFRAAALRWYEEGAFKFVLPSLACKESRGLL